MLVKLVQVQMLQLVEAFRSAKHKSVITEVKTELKLRNRAKYES
jgi:hypothetical protein